MDIASVADHPALLGTIARWHWDAWGYLDPNGSLAAWEGSLRQRMNRDRIPTIYVAMRGDELLGVAALTENDLPTRPAFNPWLSGVYVKPEVRRQGVARALVRHAVRQAAAMGVTHLYLHTFSARGLYEKLGWRVIDEDVYLGEWIAIMTIDASATDDEQQAAHSRYLHLVRRLRGGFGRERSDRAQPHGDADAGTRD